MASATVVVTARVRWWTLPLLHMLIRFCKAFHVKPDEAKVARWMVRYGVRFDVPCRCRLWWHKQA
jgi:hypothetical protein